MAVSQSIQRLQDKPGHKFMPGPFGQQNDKIGSNSTPSSALLHEHNS
jgi:hypothetical protein